MKLQISVNLKYKLMRQILLLITIFISNLTIAQIKEGVIMYKQTTYTDTESLPQNMQANIPKSNETMMELTFKDGKSIYRKDPNIKEEINDDMPRWVRRMRQQDNKTTYRDYKKSETLEQVNFFGKDFLINDTIVKQPWKVIAAEQKIILGMMCMKAIYKDSVNNLVVYFTPQIPISVGPDLYGGLPGVIMEIQSEKLHIIATEFKKEPIADTIKPPDNGSKYIRKEFDKMREEKIKEQREMWGGRK